MGDGRGRLAAVWPLVAAALCALYAVLVVRATWSAPEKGFVAFTGRRVVHVDAGGRGEAAGIRRGDVVTAIDGVAVGSTLAYAERLLSRRPGETVRLELLRDGVRSEVSLELGPAPAPVPAIVAAVLALLLLGLGLIARYGRPDDPAARRFHRTTLIYSLVYTGAISWSQLVVHPALAAVFAAMLFVAPAVAMEYALSFPTRALQVRRWRWVGWAPSLLFFVGAAVSLAVAISDERAGRATDRALVWTVAFVALQLSLTVALAAVGHAAQLAGLRQARGPERGQVRWLTFGMLLASVPTVFAIPVALRDLDAFLLVGYRPFVVVLAILWFLSNSLAVLRVRLADVEGVIRGSVAYALATSLAAGVYLAVVSGVGLAAERLAGGAGLLPHLFAAVAAAALFGPIRRRVIAGLDRRFFRDREHYVQALKELAEAVTRVREPRELARDVVERAVAALRASGGALYLNSDDAPGGGRQLLAHARGGGFAEARAPGDAAPEGGLVVPITDAASGREAAALVLGPRRDGELWSPADRALCDALASQLGVALANAEAFGRIAALGRELEAQNREIRALRDKLEDENRYLRARLEAGDEAAAIIGESKATRELVGLIERAAASEAVVLLSGESGTGKGLVARAIHRASARAEAPFIHVDCGAIPAGVFESELFGHERGAFTGAVRMRRGHVELADGGTLFLDEIGELPLPLQPKLLRALQERRFTRVGGAAEVAVDVRIIAATNRRLEEMVARGDFREDLYYRLLVLEIRVPPLRARRGDLPALVEHILPRVCRRNHRPPRTLSAEAMARMAVYGWPGNVRELENVLERAVVLSAGREIGADDLGLPDRPPEPIELVEPVALDESAPHGAVMEAVEKRRLVAALKAAGGNQSHAARALGIPRTTLINKMKRHGLL